MAVPKRNIKSNPDRLKVYAIMYYVKGTTVHFCMNRYRSTTPGAVGNGELNFAGGSMNLLTQDVLKKDANGRFLKTPAEIRQILWREVQREAKEETGYDILGGVDHDDANVHQGCDYSWKYGDLSILAKIWFVDITDIVNRCVGVAQPPARTVVARQDVSCDQAVSCDQDVGRRDQDVGRRDQDVGRRDQDVGRGRKDRAIAATSHGHDDMDDDTAPRTPCKKRYVNKSDQDRQYDAGRCRPDEEITDRFAKMVNATAPDRPEVLDITFVPQSELNKHPIWVHHGGYVNLTRSEQIKQNCLNDINTDLTIPTFGEFFHPTRMSSRAVLYTRC